MPVLYCTQFADRCDVSDMNAHKRHACRDEYLIASSVRLTNVGSVVQLYRGDSREVGKTNQPQQLGQRDRMLNVRRGIRVFSNLPPCFSAANSRALSTKGKSK